MSSRNSVSLDALVNSSLSVELNGKTYPVKPIDGFAYHLLANQTGENAVDVMYRIAARCLAPGMSREMVFGSEEVQGLSAEQVGAVVAAAQAQVEKVEALASPNSEPAGERAMSPTPL